MKFLLITLLFISVGELKSQSVNTPDDFDQYLNHRMEVEKIPGISIAITEPDGEVQFLNFGYTDPDRLNPVDEHTIYETGSITKTFTAGLLHILMEENGLTPETAVNDIIRDFAHLPARDETQMNLQHLLTHHSGLPRLPGNLSPANQADPYRDYTNTLMYDFLDQYQLPYEPGTRFVYSNLGYMLLGHIAEILGGATYDELIHHYITSELKMESTSRIPADSSRFATPTAGGFEVPEWNFDGVKGLGDLRSSASDMAKYLNMMSGQTDYEFAEYFRETIDHCTEIDDHFYAAHGWFLNTEHEDEIILHSGGTGGFSTFAAYSTVSGKGVVVLSNSDRNIDDIGLHLLNPSHRLKEVTEYLALNARQLEKLEAVYQSEGLPDFTMFKDGSRLYGRMAGQEALPLDAASETVFENETVMARIVFEIEDEKAGAFTLHQGGQSYLFERIEDYELSEPEQEADLTPEELAEYAGTYRMPEGLELTIERTDAHLTARLTGQDAFRIYPRGNDIFFYRVVDAELHFTRNNVDETDAVILHQAGQEIRFERL